MIGWPAKRCQVGIPTGWTYDNANRVTQIVQPNGTVTYGYDNANRRTSEAISGTGTWSYSFDAANRLTSTTNPASETTSFTLDNAGRVTRQDNGNTTYALNSYDTANRITEIQTKNSSATVLSDIQYTYDGVNVTSRTDSDGTVTSFGYDASDQLTSESRDNSHGTGYSISYTFDHNQNRLTKVLGGVTDTYSYDSHDKLSSTSSKTYHYDSNGNCTSVVVGGATTSLTYDDSNRVTGITYPSSATNSFVYNGEDLRVSKTDSAGTSAVITDGTGVASPVLRDARAVYTPGLSERAGTTSKFYHGDALGSTRGITNASQTVTDTVLYDAFGMTVSRTGTTATPFGFVGAQQYQSDADSGLQLLGHRYYDSSIGRFISSDPIQDGDNWYTYTENDPLNWIDPSGLAHGKQGTGKLTGKKKKSHQQAQGRNAREQAASTTKKAGDRTHIVSPRAQPQEPRDRGARRDNPLPDPGPDPNPSTWRDNLVKFIIDFGHDPEVPIPQPYQATPTEGALAGLVTIGVVVIVVDPVGLPVLGLAAPALGL